MNYLLADEQAPSLGEIMKEGVMPEGFNVAGINISPGIVSAIIVAGVLLLAAALIRIFWIPRFKMVPGKAQALLEKIVEFFHGMARDNSPHRNGFLGAYAFCAGLYIFFGTLFELLGLQIVADGKVITLPAVHSDINGCIAIALFSFGVILVGAVRANRGYGLAQALIDFSLPISMSLRLFGAMLSGLMVTELIYYVKFLYFSIALPTVVGVLFTLLHAIVQTFVLTMLTTIFYGEKTEPHVKKPRVKKARKAQQS
ncbi:MAG: F0F1 ATP synthase subunit A [Clostridia bacterium]|nr:F0F1 ATP synthase subunit A [Clostridia bacterium]